MIILDSLIHWLHVMATVVWMGGMIFVAFLLHPLLRAQLPPEKRMPLVRAVGIRFKWVEWACLAVLILTGIYKLIQMGSWEIVFYGFFGKILKVKLYLVAAMLGLSFLHTFVWGPRLAALASDSERSRLSRRVIFWARINLILGLAVILCAASLRINPL